MKFSVSQQEFSKVLQNTTRAVLTKANLPILANVLIEATKNDVELVATNLETAINATCNAKVTTPGKITVSGRNLLEFVSQIPESEITFEKLGEELVVSSNGYSARFATMGADEFPAIPKIEKGHVLKVDQESLSDCVGKVAFCASADEGRPILTGVLCEFGKSKLSMVATDGYRLSYADFSLKREEGSPSFKIVIPSRALVEVSKIITEEALTDREIRITVSDNLTQINFKIGAVVFTSRLIEGVFPNWQKTIPAAFPTKVKVKKDEFTKLVKVASIFARESGNIIKIKFENNGQHSIVSVTAAASQVGSGNVSCEADMTGSGGEIAFNFRYLLEVLGIIQEEFVNFEMIESLNPGKIKGDVEKDSFFHIIMPVRLQN